jgi:hypothetical protein
LEQTLQYPQTILAPSEEIFKADLRRHIRAKILEVRKLLSDAVLRWLERSKQREPNLATSSVSDLIPYKRFLGTVESGRAIKDKCSRLPSNSKSLCVQHKVSAPMQII